MSIKYKAFASRKREGTKTIVFCFETVAERDRWLEISSRFGGARNGYQVHTASKPTPGVALAIEGGFWREDNEHIWHDGDAILAAAYEEVR